MNHPHSARRRRTVAGALILCLSLATAGAAMANHSPGGDQTPGNVRLWDDRPFFATNNRPLAESQAFIISWWPAQNFVGASTAQIAWVDRGTAGVDISGEAILSDPNARYISVFYNNDTCAIGAAREGHIAHVEWVPAHPAVYSGFRHVGGEGLKGYRVHHPPSSFKSISIRRFLPGADFPETDENTVLEACYSFALGTRPVS
jgi:hypothetical protein